MPNSYLEVAERVLASFDRPLSAAEIIREARRKRLLPKHLYGVRQDRTLQARLSEDIGRLGERSRFFRTGPGLYSLRVFGAAGINDVGEYYARPRRKELHHTDILTLDIGLDSILRRDGSSIPLSAIIEHLTAGRYSYRSVTEILEDASAAAIHSFLVVHDGRRILSFRCGKFFPRSDPLYGRRTIGLSGAVTARQVDLLFESLFGIVANAVQELCAGIGLPHPLAERARYGREILPWFGVKSARTSHAPTTLHLVLSYRCPPDFTPTKAALSVNDLRWINPDVPLNCLEDYDTTSQFLLSEGYARDLVRHSSTSAARPQAG